MDAAAPRPWPDLPPDLVRLISGRFHEVADVVRFHAVCKPWHDMLPSSQSRAFLPWLVAPGEHNSPTIAQFRSIFSKTTWCVPWTSSRRNKWLASTDGAGAWLLTIGESKDDPSLPCLVNPFTGATTTVPPLPDWIDDCFASIDGIVCPDGTISLFSVVVPYKKYAFVAAAVLHPGDKAWTEPEWSDMIRPFGIYFTATYHGEEIVVVHDLESHMVRLRVTCSADDDVAEMLPLMRTSLAPDESERVKRQWQRGIYIFESRGELLAVCLHQPGIENRGFLEAVPEVVSVSVYALDKETASEDGKGGAQWVRRDGRSLADRVLFLGYSSSFAVDAELFGGSINGGCAYFVLNARRLAGWRDNLPDVCRVYKHCFEDDSTTVVEELPPRKGWERGSSMTWIIPQPSGIAPAHETRTRLLQAPPRKQGIPCPGSIIRVPRTGFGPYFKLYVGNLPPLLDNFHLKHFFMWYGQVADARIVCDTRTGCSWGFGFVTMATRHESDDAIAALDEEIFYGHVLRVKFGEERPEGPFVMPLLTQNKKAAPNS